MELPPVMKLTLTGRGINEHYVGTLYLRNATAYQFPSQQETENDSTAIELPVMNGAGVGYLENGDDGDFKAMLGGAGGLYHGSPRSHPVYGHEKYFPRRINDPNGATYYVVAVVLVYGFSIVLLIASHIKRKNAKALEDRQINKYLQEFQIVREKSSRDRYRNLKRDITAKLDRKHASSSSGIGSGGGSGGTGVTVGLAGVAASSAVNPYVAYRSLTKAALLPLTAVALPTIKESSSSSTAAAGSSSSIAKRTLSDPQAHRCASVAGLRGLTSSNQYQQQIYLNQAAAAAAAAYSNGRGNAVRPTLRPWAAALPMRSWRSDDSNFLGNAIGGLERRRSTTCEISSAGQLQQAASAAANGNCTGGHSTDGLCAEGNRQAKVFVQAVMSGSPACSTSSTTTTVIPIIISGPDETENDGSLERCSSLEESETGSRRASSISLQLPSSYFRRSSCPNALRGAESKLSTLTETAYGSIAPFSTPSSRRPSATLQRAASISRKRRRDSWLGAHNEHVQQQQQHSRRPSIQSQMSCDVVIDEEPEPGPTPLPLPEVPSATPHLLSSLLDFRRKSTSSVPFSVCDTTAAVTSKPVCSSTAQADGRRRQMTTCTLNVPDPFFRFGSGSASDSEDSQSRPSTSANTGSSSESTLAPRVPFDRDSGMSLTTSSVLSVITSP